MSLAELGRHMEISIGIWTVIFRLWILIGPGFQLLDEFPGLCQLNSGIFSTWYFLVQQRDDESPHIIVNQGIPLNFGCSGAWDYCPCLIAGLSGPIYIHNASISGRIGESIQHWFRTHWIPGVGRQLNGWIHFRLGKVEWNKIYTQCGRPSWRMGMERWIWSSMEWGHWGLGWQDWSWQYMASGDQWDDVIVIPGDRFELNRQKERREIWHP